MTTLLDTNALRAIVADVGLDQLMDEMTERLRRSFAEFDDKSVSTITRTGFSYDEPQFGLLEWMPSMEEGERIAMKVVGYHPENPTVNNLPSVMATTTLHDATTGRLLAITDATLLTALRTGAASALATRLLAPVDATTMLMIGCGAQAVSQIHAVSRVRPIEQVLIFDTDDVVQASLRSRLPESVRDQVALRPVHADQLKDALSHVDLVCTATSVEPGVGSVLPDGPHRPDLHVNAVGADFPGKVELPAELVRRAVVIPDDVDQCLIEGEAQRLERDELGPTIIELSKEPELAEKLAGGLTVFDSTGWAVEDRIAAELALDHATRVGVGTDVELQDFTADPYDPYELGR